MDDFEHFGRDVRSEVVVDGTGAHTNGCGLAHTDFDDRPGGTEEKLEGGIAVVFSRLVGIVEDVNNRLTGS